MIYFDEYYNCLQFALAIKIHDQPIVIQKHDELLGSA